MKFERLKDTPPSPGDWVFRQSPFPMAVFSLVMFGLIAVEWIFKFPPPAGWRWFSSIFLGLIGLVAAKAFSKTLSPENWLIRSNVRLVRIKFRSYLNDAPPDDDLVVLAMDRKDIAWFRKSRETLITPDREHGTTQQSITYLDIGLTAPPAGLAECLLQEHSRPKTGRRAKGGFVDHPVRLVENNTVLRITWRSSSACIVPGIRVALERLATHGKVLPDQTWKTDYRNTTAADMEARLADLRERGQVFEAMELSRTIKPTAKTPDDSEAAPK